MKDEAFESVERLWVYLTAPQWRDTLRDNGALSSMQARNLVERFECEHSVFQSAQRRSLLRRIIPNLKDVGAKEKSCWWEAVGRQPSAVHTVIGTTCESNTPSAHNTTGFGGVAQLTLRVLD